MTNKKEEWREIPDYEGMYMVSNRGRVKSFKFGKERFLKPNLKCGYLSIQFSKDGKKKHRTVHSLVAEAFLNHKPCGMKLVVDHIDEVKTNNNLSNLQVITNRSNLSRKGGTSKYVGVFWDKLRNKWRSQIRIDGKSKYLGCFTNEIDAHNAYQNKLKEILTNS